MGRIRGDDPSPSEKESNDLSVSVGEMDINLQSTDEAARCAARSSLLVHRTQVYSERSF